jgi:hypothetical protein
MTTDTALETEPNPPLSGPSSVSFRILLVGILHVAALSAVAVAQPLFDLLGRNAEFFVARGSEPIDIWLLVLALILAIPALALLVELPVRLAGVLAYRVVHSVIIGALFAALAVQVLKRVVPVNGWVLIALALLAGAAFGYAYNRFETLRTFLTWLSPAPLIVATLFLVFTPVSRLVFPSAAADAVGTIAASDTPVVIVVWDEMHSVGLTGADGLVDRNSFPNTARLADDARWYRKASGMSDSTSFAVPPIVDGMLPVDGLLPIAVDHPRNLFSILGGSHEVVVREPVTALCPDSVCEETAPESERLGFAGRMRSLASDIRVVYLHVVIPEDLAGGLPAIDRVWGDFGANAADYEGESAGGAADSQELRAEFADRRANSYIVEELSTDRAASVEDFIADIPAPTARPLFVFLHAALPHAPYRYAPSGRQYRDSGELPGLVDGRWTEDDWVVAQAEQRFLMQTEVADRLLGDLIDKMEDEGWYDEALIIVTSDHGVGFSPGGFVRSVTPENFGETMSVPLIVKLPDQTSGEVLDADARTVDIMPTVLGALGIEIDWEVDGRSLLLDQADRGLKEAFRSNGSVIEGDPLMPAWDVALSNKIRRFADGDGVIDVYRSSYSAIIGSPVEDLVVARESAGTAEVNALQSLDDIDPAGSLSPSHLTGRIRFAEPTEGEVAVALNGVIQVVGPLVEPDSLGGRFSYFVPEEAFLPGANAVAFYLVPDPNEPTQIVPIDLTSARVYRTSMYADGEEYLEADGIGVPITSHHTGGIDAVIPRGAAYGVAGWAADLQAEAPAGEIVVVVDGVSVLVSAPNLRRVDVGDALGNPVYADSGFSLEVASDVIDRADSVRVFAVTQDVAATELVLPEGAFGS